MKRREFITLLGGSAARRRGGAAARRRGRWRLARSQQPAMPVVGFLHSGSPGPFASFVAAFHQGLGEAGYIEDKNVRIEYRWAENYYDRLPALAAELVRHAGGRGRRQRRRRCSCRRQRRRPRASRSSSRPCPDPVKAELVVSLNRPGGNMTGTAALTAELDAKRLEILRELVPYGDLIGALINPNRPDAKAQSRDVQEAARAPRAASERINAGSEHDIDAAFAALGRQRITSLLIVADPFFTSRHPQLAALTARHNVPAIYATRDFADSGGLVS